MCYICDGIAAKCPHATQPDCAKRCAYQASKICDVTYAQDLLDPKRTHQDLGL